MAEAAAAAAPVPPSAQPAAETASEEASSPAAAASPAVSSPAASSPAQLAQLSLDSTWAEAFPPEVRSKMLEAAAAPSSPGSADGSRARLLALYEHGKQERRRRRESSGRSALEQGCTFKPEISSKAKRLGRGAPSSPPSPSGDGGGGDAGAVDARTGTGTGTGTGAGTSTSSSSVFESLYASARTAQHKQEEARRAALERSAPSFKPSINKVSKKELDKAAAVSRFEALYANALTHQRELKKRQETARDAECTFEPRVNATPGHGKGGAGGSTGPERLEELYKHARAAEEKRRQQQENSLRQLTFRPAINKASADKYSRGGDIAKMCPDPAEIKSKLARLEETRLAREMQGCTFAPRVSVQPGAEPARRAAGDVHSRLYEHAKQRAVELAQQRQDSLAVPPQHPDLSLTQGAAATSSNSSSSSSSARAAGHEHEQQRTPASGEAPASPASSARSARTGISARSAGKVVTPETLKTFARLYREGKESTARKLKEEREGAARRASSEWERNRSECTFTPSIPDASRALAERSRPHAAAAQDIFERLHAESSAKQLQREIDAQDRLGLDLACTFSPRISDSSKELLKRRSEQRRRSADGAQGARLKSAADRGLLPNDEELAKGWAGAEAGDEADHVALAAVTSPQREAPLDDCQRLFLREAADLDAQDLELAAARRASWGQ
jgi:hypothetical protein